jgi:hypothetical protein
MSGTSDKPEQSPGLLSSPPTRGPGVRRLNRLPIVFGVGAAMLVVAAIGYTYRERLMQSAANAQQAASHQPEPASGPAVLTSAPIGGEVKPAVANISRPPRQGVPPAHTVRQLLALPSDSGGNASREDDAATKAQHEAWPQLAQLQNERLTAAKAAMTADTVLSQNHGWARAAAVRPARLSACTG